MIIDQEVVQGDDSIQIAGAGSAGLSAAITLARSGRKVVVHEAHAEVGYRFQGDFQGLENWSTEQDALYGVAGIVAVWMSRCTAFRRRLYFSMFIIW